jgi:hypothetical protein
MVRLGRVSAVFRSIPLDQYGADDGAQFRDKA